jgi:hypothetical protein
MDKAFEKASGLLSQITHLGVKLFFAVVILQILFGAVMANSIAVSVASFAGALGNNGLECLIVLTITYLGFRFLKLKK